MHRVIDYYRGMSPMKEEEAKVEDFTLNHFTVLAELESAQHDGRPVEELREQLRPAFTAIRRNGLTDGEGRLNEFGLRLHYHRRQFIASGGAAHNYVAEDLVVRYAEKVWAKGGQHE